MIIGKNITCRWNIQFNLIPICLLNHITDFLSKCFAKNFRKLVEIRDLTCGHIVCNQHQSTEIIQPSLIPFMSFELR